MTTLTRRRDEQGRRRRAILKAARELFWERGYRDTTMSDVAAAADLAPGTLYLYFPGKSALYSELLAEGYERLQKRLEAAVVEGAPPRAQAEALVDAFFEFAGQHPRYFDIMYFVRQREADAGGEGALEPGQVERLEARRNACKAVAAGVLRRGGLVAAGDDLAATVDALWSMLVGTIWCFRKAEPERFSAIGRQARRLLTTALFGGQ